jgi:glucosyl-dolichyl phosphate glucuronosyltransferase
VAFDGARTLRPLSSDNGFHGCKSVEECRVKITVVLCTYNRARDLARALQCAAALRVAEGVNWECIVVDNNSTDETREIVADVCHRYPNRFSYVFEKSQGLSHARNRGIRESRGDVIAFMDDDVIVEPDWLQNLTAGLADGTYVGSGGRIVPERTFSPPTWLSLEYRYALAPLAMFDLGLQPGRLEESPFGANMAFTRKMFDKYGFFRADLGRCGANLMSGEDTEFGDRLLAAGENLRYEPSAVVYHPIPYNRIQQRYFLQWWFGKGRSEMRQKGPRPGARRYLGGVPLYLFRSFAGCAIRWAFSIGSAKRFHRKLKLWAIAGAFVECAKPLCSIQPARSPQLLDSSLQIPCPKGQKDRLRQTTGSH